MSKLVEVGCKWSESVMGMFDPSDGRLIEMYTDYSDYDGVSHPITVECEVVGYANSPVYGRYEVVNRRYFVAGQELIDRGCDGTYLP